MCVIEYAYTRVHVEVQFLEWMKGRVNDWQVYITISKVYSIQMTSIHKVHSVRTAYFADASRQRELGEPLLVR
jgi:hypothetical protein